jgi:hypothetical protein
MSDFSDIYEGEMCKKLAVLVIVYALALSLGLCGWLCEVKCGSVISVVPEW